MNTSAKLSLLAALALGLGTFAAIPQAHAGTRLSVAVGFGPPPPRFERMPGPRAGFFWSTGYWHWHRHRARYVWVPGRWHRARPGYTIGRPYWRPDRDRRVYRDRDWRRDRWHAHERREHRRWHRNEWREHRRHDNRRDHRWHRRHQHDGD